MESETTWVTRDLPVLQTIVSMTDEGAYLIRPSEIADRIGMDGGAVERACAALAAEYPPFFEFEDVTDYDSESREIDCIRNPTGHARRTIGAWPTAASLADQIVAGLNQAAEAEDDEEKQGRIRRLAAWFGGAGRDVLVDVTSNVIVKSTGLG